MHQPSFSDIEYSLRKRTTKRDEFLKGMEEFIPWDEWVAYIEPYYPKGQVKRFFGYSKTVYKGLAKNTHRLHMLFTSANLLMCIRAGRPLPA